MGLSAVHMDAKKFLVGTVLLFVPLVAAAQVTIEDSFVDESGNLIVEETALAPAGTVSCFDYYTFGSVQAKLTAPVTGTVSGAPITFSGTLTNENPYPIVDGSLYVKIFKSRGPQNDGNGPDVVDQFFAVGDVAIPAKGSAPVSFSWRVPSYAQSGEYQLATFFVTSRKFNLLGLSFTDDVVGNTVPFTVSGERGTGVAFDKARVTVDGDPYFFAAFPPRTSSSEPVTVTARVRNTTSESQNVSVMWTVYQWDLLLRKNAVQEETKSVMVPAGGSALVSITISDTRFPVYLAVATLSWKDTKSIIGVRFVREGVNRTRINFPGVMAFPLVKGQEATLFSCLHNSGSAPSVPNGRLELTLLDTEGNLIHNYVYTGDVTGAMMGVVETFVPRKTYDKFVLEARLYEGNTFIDEARLEYDCRKIDPSTCVAGAAGAFSFFDFLSGSGALGTGVAILVIILLLLLALFLRKWLGAPKVSSLEQ
ncbi:hypothetical protein HYW60_03015 [Candidatus Kaiserbacteria bacterium]|nr:hypothetical protein [Candidatus Kaiserbacteria bacterium]